MPDETKKYFKEDILREQVRLAIKQLPTVQIASFIVALTLSYTVRDIVPHIRILIWGLMVLTIVVSRIVLSYQFLKVSQRPFDGEYWKNAFLLLALISGVIWGLSAFLIFPANNPALISLFVLVVASLSASTTISHSSIKFGPAVWAGPAMLLYAVRCAWEGGETEDTIAFLTIIYLATIIHYSFNHNRTITSAISLKFENLELLEELQKTNDILRRTSAVDGLTGLANRYSFEEFMEREWRRAIRDRKPLSLIMADIDHFKAFNDNYGHQGGDDCLKKVAWVIAASVKRPADLAARYGGEEFMAVLPDTDLNGALEIAEMLRRGVEALNIPHEHSSTAGVVTISVGVASLIPEQVMSSSHLVKLVDMALYSAKHAGRNMIRAA
jgi:diguanylate cyclase (GGDEF)-like protein